MEILQAGISALGPTINSLSQELIKGTINAGTSRLKNLLVSYEVGFSEYAARLYEQCSLVKTLLHRYQPINIDRIYIDAYLTLGPSTITENEFANGIDEFRRSVVTGSAGSGKSLFLKHLAVHYCQHPLGRLPIFIELRQLNADENPHLIEYIADRFARTVPEFTQKQFLFGLERGKFILLFDALDEIEPGKREVYSKQIIDLSAKYPAANIVISSRPDDQFVSWNQFNTFSISDFTKEQVLAFVEKIPYDQAIKSSFTKIIPTVYTTHQTFLSNPLLCTMMLMTYDEFADVPSKMHIFYDQALDVLFRKHDASKSFIRKLHTNLTVEEFRSVFETFCLVSYLESAFSMTEPTIKRHIRDALEFEEKSEKPDLYLRDLQDSFSILLREGLQYSFLHRSLQEYCTASFLTYRQGSGIYELLDRVVMSDAMEIVRLMYDISGAIFEEKYFLSKLSELNSAVSEIDIEKQPVDFFRMLYLGISLDDEDGVVFTVKSGDKFAKWHPILEIAETQYLDVWHGARSIWPTRQEFDWLHDEADYEPNGEDLTNERLIGTAIVPYLTSVRDGLVKIEKLIRTRSKGKSLRVATILKKH